MASSMPKTVLAIGATMKVVVAERTSIGIFA